ncbi:MAG: hypothetical protein JNM74_06715 [Myxococcales bacterium]|jgi:hypothetical protein|nr:hypothetical protein [Myxococcales bacterium]
MNASLSGKLASSRVRALFAFVGLGLAALVAVAEGACSNQSEGQRCSTLGENGGSDDCQSPLVCKQKSLLNGAQDDLCCPQNPAQATVPACQSPSSDASIPPSPSDAGDAATDAPTTDSGDGGTDSSSPPADGGDAGPGNDGSADATTD